jgi:hypothetical protein
MNLILISELINKDGTRISGDKKIDQVNNMTASNLTTDDFVSTTRQGISFYNNFGRVYVGEDDDTNDGVKVPDGDKPKKTKKSKKHSPMSTKLKENSKKRMESIIEDIFTKKDFDKEFVEKKTKDLKLNGIQDLEVIKETNPILIRKVATLRDVIEKNSTSGEEKAIILNYLLSMDTTDIPTEYKEELKKKLG